MGGSECRMALVFALAMVLRHAHCQRVPAAASLFGSSAPALPADAWDFSDDARERELQRLKQGILEGLGMKKLPDTSRMNVSREEYERMYKVYLEAMAANKRREGEAEEQYIIPHLTSRRFYSFTSDVDGGWKVRIRRTTDSNGSAVSSLFFPVEIPELRRRHKTASIRRATLRLLITTAYHTPPGEATVNVLLKPRVNGTAPTLIEQRQVHLTPGQDLTTQWIEFDLTDTVSNWVRDPPSNKGLMIECKGCIFNTSSFANDTSSSPRLNVFVSVRRNSSRTKRSYDVLSQKRRGRTDCRKDGERCCRHQMEVVFDQLKGFEFILQPKKFDAGFCKGRCPPRYNPAHHHALLQSLIWKQNRKLAPKPCCAPSKLKALEILRLDEDDPTRLKVSHWENIEVIECACS